MPDYVLLLHVQPTGFLVCPRGGGVSPEDPPGGVCPITASGLRESQPSQGAAASKVCAVSDQRVAETDPSNGPETSRRVAGAAVGSERGGRRSRPHGGGLQGGGGFVVSGRSNLAGKCQENIEQVLRALAHCLQRCELPLLQSAPCSQRVAESTSTPAG